MLVVMMHATILILQLGDDHAWKKCGIWESHSQEILLLEGKLCNFEGKFIIQMDLHKTHIKGLAWFKMIKKYLIASVYKAGKKAKFPWNMVKNCVQKKTEIYI